MDELLLHPHTKAELSALRADPPHALLLIAPTGTGKRAVATWWASMFTTPDSISALEPDEKGTITIDATRALYQRTRAKQSGHQVVVVDHAEAMSLEAQNAFLKLLEEPRQRLTFILTAPSLGQLLPTIASRVQTVQLRAVTTQALAAYAKKQKADITDQELQQLLFVAQGRPATMWQLLQDPSAFASAKTVMQRAKSLIAAAPYERLATVNELSRDRLTAIATLEAMAHMLQLQLRRDQSAKWLQLADALQLTLARLHQNGNPRAQLTHLFLSY